MNKKIKILIKYCIYAILIIIVVVVFMSSFFYHEKNKRHKISEKCKEEVASLISKEQEEQNRLKNLPHNRVFIAIDPWLTYQEKYDRCLQNNGYYRYP